MKKVLNSLLNFLKIPLKNREIKILIVSHIHPYNARAGNEVRNKKICQYFTNYLNIKIIYLFINREEEEVKNIDIKTIFKNNLVLIDTKINNFRAELYGNLDILKGLSYNYEPTDDILLDSNILYRYGYEVYKDISHFQNRQVTNLLINEILKFNKIHKIIFSYVFFAGVLGFSHKLHKKMIVDTHDIFSKGEESTNIPAPKLNKNQERILLSYFKNKIAITESDEIFLTKDLKLKGAITAKVDYEYKPIISDQSNSIGILASSNHYNRYYINYFINNTWEKILTVKPDMKLLVYGSVVGDLDVKTSDTVILHKYIGDIEAIYENFQTCINPSRQKSGFKVKNLEAIFYGKNLVTYAENTNEVDYDERNNFYLAGNEEEFVRQVIKASSIAPSKISRELELEYDKKTVYKNISRIIIKA